MYTMMDMWVLTCKTKDKLFSLSRAIVALVPDLVELCTSGFNESGHMLLFEHIETLYLLLKLQIKKSGEKV